MSRLIEWFFNRSERRWEQTGDDESLKLARNVRRDFTSLSPSLKRLALLITVALLVGVLVVAALVGLWLASVIR